MGDNERDQVIVSALHTHTQGLQGLARGGRHAGPAEGSVRKFSLTRSEARPSAPNRGGGRAFGPSQ